MKDFEEALALVLAGLSLSEDEVVAGGWVRAALVAVWAIAALVLASRGPVRLAGI